MARAKLPITQAMRVLREHGVAWTDHPYAYEPRGGTAVSARELGVDEHAVIKTLVMEDERKRPLIVLMHGDREVSAKNLARTIGVKQIAPCDPVVADRHSGYQVGGTSPFGTRRAIPVYMERSIADLSLIYVNGGRRGYLVSRRPRPRSRLPAVKALALTWGRRAACSGSVRGQLPMLFDRTRRTVNAN